MPDQLYKAVLKGRFTDGSETRNIFYATSADAQSGIPLAFQGYVARFLQTILYALSSTMHFYGVDVYAYVANEVWQLVTETLLDLTGLASADSLPHQIAGVLIGATHNGRSKGKKFIPGLTENASDGGNINSQTLGYLASALAAWITDYTETINGAVIHPVVHRKGKSDLDFAGGKTDNIVGSQRRRKQGVGL